MLYVQFYVFVPSPLLSSPILFSSPLQYISISINFLFLHISSITLSVTKSTTTIFHCPLLSKTLHDWSTILTLPPSVCNHIIPSVPLLYFHVVYLVFYLTTFLLFIPLIILDLTSVISSSYGMVLFCLSLVMSLMSIIMSMS